MVNPPLISVIIPIYKVEDYLRECVDSVLGQTYRNLEVILVDDGSPDNCGAICDDYAAKDARIKVIHKENGGLSDARNAGLDLCTGEYISFVDSDDVVHPQFLEVLLKNLVEANADISMCTFTQGHFASFEESHVKLFNDYLEFLLHYNDFQNKVVVWNKLYKSLIWKELRFEKGKYHEDEFIFHLVVYRRRIIFTNLSLYFYRSRENSIISYKTERHYLDSIDALQNRYVFFKEIDGCEQYAEKIKTAIKRRYVELFMYNRNEFSREYLLRNIFSLRSSLRHFNWKEKIMLYKTVLLNNF